MQDKPAYLMILLEFQSSPDPWMTVRFLVYIGLLYQQLIKDKQLKSGKLPPVFPVVLYNDNRTWQGPVDLKKLIDLPSGSKLWPYQPQLRYYLIDESEQIEYEADTLTSLLFKLEKADLESGLIAYLDKLMTLLDTPKYTQVSRDFLTWIHHVLEPLKQTEFDFSDVETINEAKNMLRENVIRWKEGYIQAGIQQGIEKGEAKLLIKLLTKRFGQLPHTLKQKIQQASADELEQWALNTLTATTIDDVF